MTAARPENGHFGNPPASDDNGVQRAGGRERGLAPAAAIPDEGFCRDALTAGIDRALRTAGPGQQEDTLMPGSLSLLQRVGRALRQRAQRLLQPHPQVHVVHPQSDAQLRLQLECMEERLNRLEAALSSGRCSGSAVHSAQMRR